MVWLGRTSCRLLGLGAWAVNSYMNVGNGLEDTMDNRHQEQMLRCLRPVLKDRAKAEQIISRFWRNKIAIVWETIDVHRAANEREVALTEREAMTVVETLHRQHDKQAGLKWQDITDHIEDQVLGRKLTKREVYKLVHLDQLTIQR